MCSVFLMIRGFNMLLRGSMFRMFCVFSCFQALYISEVLQAFDAFEVYEALQVHFLNAFEVSMFPSCCMHLVFSMFLTLYMF